MIILIIPKVLTPWISHAIDISYQSWAFTITFSPCLIATFGLWLSHCLPPQDSSWGLTWDKCGPITLELLRAPPSRNDIRTGTDVIILNSFHVSLQRFCFFLWICISRRIKGANKSTDLQGHAYVGYVKGSCPRHQCKLTYRSDISCSLSSVPTFNKPNLLSSYNPCLPSLSMEGFTTEKVSKAGLNLVRSAHS